MMVGAGSDESPRRQVLKQPIATESNGLRSSCLSQEQVLGAPKLLLRPLLKCWSGPHRPCERGQACA